jgi:hypothetical protein
LKLFVLCPVKDTSSIQQGQDKDSLDKRGLVSLLTGALLSAVQLSKMVEMPPSIMRKIFGLTSDRTLNPSV